MTETNVSFRHINLIGDHIYRHQNSVDRRHCFGRLFLHHFSQKKWIFFSKKSGPKTIFRAPHFVDCCLRKALSQSLFLMKNHHFTGFCRITSHRPVFESFWENNFCPYPPPSSNHQHVSFFGDALSFPIFLPPLSGWPFRGFLFLMIRRRGGAAIAQGR